MQNKILLGIGIALILFGIVRPNFNMVAPTCPVSINYVIDAPSNEEILIEAQKVIDILKLSDDSTRPSDCLKLSSLYADMAILIEIDDDVIIKDTAAIKEANSLAGKMLQLNIKDKYPNLAEASKSVIVIAVGDDDILLDNDSRKKAAEAFRALSWAFYNGSK